MRSRVAEAALARRGKRRYVLSEYNAALCQHYGTCPLDDTKTIFTPDGRVAAIIMSSWIVVRQHQLKGFIYRAFRRTCGGYYNATRSKRFEKYRREGRL